MGRGRHGGLMVCALVFASSGPGSSPGQGHFVVVFLHGQDTVLSRCLSPPRCINGYQQT